jgi:hypothetical protein
MMGEFYCTTNFFNPKILVDIATKVKTVLLCAKFIRKMIEPCTYSIVYMG